MVINRRPTAPAHQARTEPAWVRWFLITIAIGFLTIFVVLPLVVVFTEAFSKGIGAYLAALSDPVVLFVHPWEFVDLRRERLRVDCRFRTGDIALECVRTVLRDYRAQGAQFTRMAELAA